MMGGAALRHVTSFSWGLTDGESFFQVLTSLSLLHQGIMGRKTCAVEAKTCTTSSRLGS